MNRHASQPRAIYYAVALQIWERFSFYGMCALLILYLTNQLEYSDNHVYELFGAHCSLVYAAPALGGSLAGKVLSNYMAVILGALLMVIGHVVLGASEIRPSSLYPSLAVIVYGYGLFELNINCLLGELYEPADPRRDGGFSLMYAVGSVGSIIVSVTCGFAQEEYGRVMGFGLTVVDMIVGLVILLCSNCHFTHTHSVNKRVLRMANFLLPSWGWLLVLLMTTPALITVLFQKEWLVYILTVATIIGLGVLTKTYRRAENQKQCREPGLVTTLIFSSMLFWAFAQWGDSSISLYIDRSVNRGMFGYTVPTAMFQPTGTFAVMLCGVSLAWVVRESVASNRTVRIRGKFAFDLSLMSAGFYTLTSSARWFATYSYSSLSLMVLGLMVMGFTELFIDSIAISQIIHIEISGVTNVLANIYVLLSSAIVNYPAGVIADQTSRASFDASGTINYSVNTYTGMSDQITQGALAYVGLVLTIWLYQALKFRNCALALES